MSYLSAESTAAFSSLPFNELAALDLDSEPAQNWLSGSSVAATRADDEQSVSEPVALRALDRAIGALHAGSDNVFQSQFSLFDQAIQSTDPVEVTAGVIGKSAYKVLEAGSNAALGAVDTVRHPLISLGHLWDAATSPQETLTNWWSNTDWTDKSQSLLSLGLGAKAGSAVIPQSVKTAVVGAMLAGGQAVKQRASFLLQELTRGPFLPELGATGVDSLTSILGGGLYVPKSLNDSSRFDRDFSKSMHLTDEGYLSYLRPALHGYWDHDIHAQIDADTGNLTFGISRSSLDSAGLTYGTGKEMFNSMVRKYANHGFSIGSITGDWQGWGGSTTNLEAFNAGLAQGLSPTEAASRTWTGQRAASIGLTHIDVPGNPDLWASGGVHPTFSLPDWGSESAWRDYATRLGTAVPQR